MKKLGKYEREREREKREKEGRDMEALLSRGDFKVTGSVGDQP